MKKIFSLFVALTAVFSLSAKTLYLQPNTGNDSWASGDARFAICILSEPQEWLSMTAVEGETGIYSAEVETDKQIIFCRMDPATTENNWDNKWNQTEDLSLPSGEEADKDLFVIDENTNIFSGSKAQGAWSVFVPTPVPPVVVLKDLFLVPNQWANEDAKIAAWYWKKGEGGAWTSFLAPKAEGNDTLLAKVNAEADSIIFVRFKNEETEPRWEGPNQLNQTVKDSIQWEKAVCTILPGGGYESSATWDVYVPEPKGKYYIIGDAGIVGEEKAWQPDGIKAMTDTTVLDIKAGSYSMRLTLDGTWEGGQRDYRHLTEITPGLGEYVDDYANHNITFTLDADGEVTVIYIAAHDEEPEVFKVLGTFHVAKNGYYLFGSHNDWALVDEQKFEPNGEVEGEYKLVITLTEGEEIKPALVKNDNVADEDWFGSNYEITAADAGEKTIYFRPAGNSEWEAFGGFIWIENGTTAVENTAAESKVVKMIENGQLIIIKGDMKYNVMGTVVK